MKAKLSVLALGVSAAALLVASWGLNSTITQARRMNPGVQSDLLRSTEIIRVRMDKLERQNAELREALTAARTRLQSVESVYASSSVGMASVTDRIVKLEESSSETGRAMFRFGSRLMATRQALGLTDPKPEGEAEEEEEEPEEEPKIEDYLRVEMDPINGLPGPHIIVEGANLHVRSGSGGTDDLGGLLFGLGNVVIGYNEYDQTQLRARTGSHNLVLGSGHGYSSFGGLLAGFANEVNAPNSSVSGGTGNAANGWASSISGGRENLVTEEASSVAGGIGNKAADKYATVCGGQGNRATAESSSVAGGTNNEADAKYASVTGGTDNRASGWASSVTGGQRNVAIGDSSTVTGGAGNQTLANSCTIAGGMNETLDQEGYTQAGYLAIFPTTEL